MSDYSTSEKQQRFIEFLFTPTEEGGAAGNVQMAKEMAGYHPTYSNRALLATKEIRDGIEKATKEFFTQTAPESAMSMLSVLRSPTTPGSKQRLEAAKELLDRGGFVKTEKVDVNASGGVFLLPPKDDSDD